MSDHDAVYLGTFHGTPIFADDLSARERLYMVMACTHEAEPPEWSIPLGYDERDAKI